MSYCVGKFIWFNDIGVILVIFIMISFFFVKFIVCDMKEVKENFEVKCLEVIFFLWFINGYV